MANVQILTQTILPFSLHGINPRTIMGEYNWNKIKKEKQMIADHHCMCCGEYVSHTRGDWLECHEVYDIDLNKREFRIKDFVCLCKKCHDYIHQGRLRMLVSEGQVTQAYYEGIIERGDKLLHDNNLVKKDLPATEIENPEWHLFYNGKLYSK